MTSGPMFLHDLDRNHKLAALNILCAAFHDYPVTRYVIAEADPEYDGKLRELINLFVRSAPHAQRPAHRSARAEELLGVAVVSPPKEIAMPPELAECYCSG
jgi:hypothetical protein